MQISSDSQNGTGLLITVADHAWEPCFPSKEALLRPVPAPAGVPPPFSNFGDVFWILRSCKQGCKSASHCAEYSCKKIEESRAEAAKFIAQVSVILGATENKRVATSIRNQKKKLKESTQKPKLKKDKKQQPLKRKLDDEDADADDVSVQVDELTDEDIDDEDDDNDDDNEDEEQEDEEDEDDEGSETSENDEDDENDEGSATSEDEEETDDADSDEETRKKQAKSK